MKRITYLIALLFLGLWWNGNAQISINEDFESGAPGWTSGDFFATTTGACEGTSRRDNLWSFSTSGTITSPNIAGLSNATDLALSFDYKVVNFSSLAPTAPGWGSFEIQYSLNNGADWISVDIINDDNHVTSDQCADLNYTISGDDLPVGSDFQLRILANWASGDWYLYLDNISATQQAQDPPLCDATLTNPLNGDTAAPINGNITWSIATGIPTGYFLTAGTSPGGNDLANNIDVGNTNTYAFGQLLYSTTYYITITPYNAIGVTNDTCIEQSFTTQDDPSILVDCTGSPVNTTYCYGNSDNTTFLFTSSDGSPLRITFNAGSIEGGFDDLTIYDGVDNTGAILFNNNSAGINVFDGLTFDSTGNSLFLEVDSDTSVSCSSGSRIEWDFDVSCATCTNPEATFAVVSDCVNGEQFLVDVDVTSLGSANTLSITDDQGNAPLSVDAVGTYSFGPYPNNTNVTISVSNDDDANCVVSSSALTQEFCLDSVVDCTGGPLNVSYCYVNSDTNVFTYTSSDGSPLSLTINSGFVENTWDELIILDSDGVTNLNAATPYGAGGNIAGLTFQSSGDSISFWVQADGVFSCDSGSAPMNSGIEYTVACATCVNPVATFNVVSDCLNAPQFFVEVDVTDLGSAGSLTLTDDQGGDPVVINAAGITTFGPYPNLTEVVISVANDDDSNCVVNSSTLTQEFCIENTVDCTSGPINAFYCYGNNDTNVFQYTSSDGSPLNLVINSGNVENTWDELVILDSDGVTNLNEANPYGTGGNISGLTFQSSGDTIFFTITSDGSVSCASSGAPLNQGINYTVSCATCINPQATYQVIDDCANGDQFLVDVNVTSLGDAESVTISDNQGSAPVSVSTTGITQFGPYPFLTDIIFTISNDQDVNCVINSAAIQLLACPPDNDNCDGATTAQVNTTDACDVVTSGTILAATPSGVPAGSCAGDPDDDVWFEFVAQDEVQIISLINIAGGTFNLDHAVYEGSCGNLTELYCSDGTSSVTPQLVVGNTYFIRVYSFGSADETTTFDLCIRRAPTNIICDNAVNFCTDGEALVTSNIIGIPNTGQIACLFTAPNPTWNIIQIGDPGLIELEIAQTNEAGNGIDVDFVLWGPFSSLDDVCSGLDNGCPNPSDCPNNTTSPDFYPFGNIVDCSYSFISTETATINNAQTGEIYILLVTNFSNQPGTIAISQTNAGAGDSGTITAEIEAVIESEEVIFVDVDEDPSTPDVAEVCGFESVTIFANSPFADTFIWYKDGFVIEGETGPSLTVTESDNYQVQAFDEQCDTDAFSQIVDIRIYREAIANQPPDIVTCEEPGSNGIEDFDLDSQIPVILGDQDPSLFTVSFYTSIADANQAINPLTSPFDSAGQTIFVRVEDVSAAADGFLGCRAITQFELVISGPTPTVTSVDFEVCDDVSRDGVEIFDLSSHDAAILDGQNPVIFNVSYYLTQADADAGMNAIASPFTNTSNPQTIFARVESNVAVDCFSITDFDLVVDAVPFATFNSNEVDYEVCPNATVPIEISLVPEGYTEADVTIEWELDNAPFNEGNGLTIPVLLAGTYTAVITFNNTGCEFVVSADVIELEQCVIPEGISPNNDGLNDRFDLSSFGVVKLEIFNRNGTLVYSKDNYRDEWFGQTDKGENLPVGTYFYTMIYEGGAKKRSAWVYISR
jgi:gliding motility-associated-like protein